MKYTPLHCHTDASLLDGLSSAEELAKRYKAIGATGGAITDHGVIFNVVDFLKAMEKEQLKPVIGIELYICEQHASIQTPENRKLLHLVILAKNTQGYKQILKIVHESNKPEHYYYKPRLSLDQLSVFLDGNVIGFSGHLGSNIADVLEKQGVESGIKVAEYFERIFGKGNFWLETQLMDREHSPQQVTTTEKVRELSKLTGIPIIATCDAHYAEHADAELQRIILCSNMKTTLKKALEPGFMLRGFFISDNFHVPTYEEMVSYGHTLEELENTNKILEQIEPYQILSKPQLPKFDCPNGLSDNDYLKQLCREGWAKFISPNIPKEKHVEYADRVKYELDIIEEAGLSSYFLIVADIVKEVNRRGYLSGTSRGSAGGCLVSFLIEITKLDPIPYELQFSRFYNKARVGSLPDIDIDVEAGCREDIIQYIKDKYGHDRVSQLVTFQNIKGSRALKEVFRAYGDVAFEEINAITKNIIEEHKITDELQAMKDRGEEPSIIRWCLKNRADKFSDWCVLNDDDTLSGPYAKQFDQAMHLEGVKASQSKHAAGIVIGSKPLDEIGPLVLDTKNNNFVFGYGMEPAEAVGLVKMDILGLHFLDKMHLISKLNSKFTTDIRNYKLNDDKTWNLLKSGQTKSCFQLESQLGQSFAKKLKPEHIEHLGALTAILRPGCLEAFKSDGKSVTEHYIKRKNGEEVVEYIHPALEPILKTTYGELIYQEGAAKIATDIAGFTPEEAQLLIKAIGKKKADVMAKIKVEFKTGIEKANVVPKEVGDEIFSWIEASQRYGFNKAHAIGYSLNTYLSAYAKAHFPLEFYTSNLYYSRDRLKPQQEVYELVNDAKNFGIFIQPPDIKKLNSRFALINDKIYFGLTDIKHVGEGVIDTLKECQEFYFKHWYFFLTFVSDKINSRAMEGLINAGALDCYNLPRIQMLFEYGLWNELSDREKKWLNQLATEGPSLIWALDRICSGGTGKNFACANKNRLEKVKSLLNLMQNPPYPLVDKPHQIAQFENTLLGVCLTATFLDESDAKFRANCSCQEFKNGFNNQNGYLSIACQVDKIRITTTKKGLNPGQEMGFVTVMDDSGTADNIVAFPDAWDMYKGILAEGNRVLISGKKSKEGSLSIENVEQL